MKVLFLWGKSGTDLYPWVEITRKQRLSTYVKQVICNLLFILLNAEIGGGSVVSTLQDRGFEKTKSEE